MIGTARCVACHNEYDPDTVEEEFDEDPYVIENEIQGYYRYYRNRCCDCAIEAASADLNQGLEDLSYRWGED